jgi:N-acyl amino acid synthase of PEP-CTERM/exosortase system
MARDVSVGPFSVTFGVGTSDRNDEYRLRYRVFVQECGFIPDRFPSQLERDEFDDASCAFVLRDDASGDIAACQRLVLPDWLPTGTRTNVERQYRPMSDGSRFDFAAQPLWSWAEASRTTVAPKYRWGSSGTSLPALVAMRYTSVALALALGRQALLALSEPSTARLIRRLAFSMTQIGAAVEYHGIRAPYLMDIAAMARSVPESDRPLIDELIGAATTFLDANRQHLPRSRRVA